MIAFDVLEQLDTGFLQLIAADARGHRAAHRVEVAVDEVIAESAHGEECRLAVLE